MKNCLTPLRNEFTKIQFSQFLLLITRFIFTWNLQILVQVVFLSINSLKERKLSRLNLVYLTKQNQKCPLFIKNYVESYQLSRHTNATSLDHHSLFIFIVTINQIFNYGDAKDNYHIAFSDIMLSLRISRT